MGTSTPLSRREFLHVAGSSLGAFLFPRRFFEWGKLPFAWPILQLEQLPPKVSEILSLVPRTRVSVDGFLHLFNQRGLDYGCVPQAYTQWNREHLHSYDRLRTDLPWAIVLHWYGDNEQFDQTLTGYLRGFDSLRKIDDYETRTSAHFLVGPDLPGTMALPNKSVGIVQTQAPDLDGIPFLASHLQPIDLQLHAAHRQYFVRALYQLGYEHPELLFNSLKPGMISLLQDFYDGHYLDQNLRTLAIEITGSDFEHPEHFPSPQQIANVVSLVWALMKRYQVRATNLLGHLEIQLNKADPGKKFMSLIRQLIGLKALIEDDEEMKLLVFGQFIGPDGDVSLAVIRYFRFVRDYLVLVGMPRDVFEWEPSCNYWHCQRLLGESIGKLPFIGRPSFPLGGDLLDYGRSFLNPENHEGVDLYPQSYRAKAYRDQGQPVHLVADGTCLYVGEALTCSHGKVAIFQHYQLDGSQVLSIYGHLAQLGDLQTGVIYPQACRLGETMSAIPQENRFLHFAMAYGATWDTYLSKSAALSPNVGRKWIIERYLPPLEFLIQNPRLSQNRIHFE